MDSHRALVLVKVVHTALWAFFVACILGVPVSALVGHLTWAVALSVVVVAECVVLAANHYRCPLTDVAARYTDERADNFDIYLPLSLARYNKQVFGSLFLAGELVMLWCWLR